MSSCLPAVNCCRCWNTDWAYLRPSVQGAGWKQTVATRLKACETAVLANAKQARTAAQQQWSSSDDLTLVVVRILNKGLIDRLMVDRRKVAAKCDASCCMEKMGPACIEAPDRM